MDAKKKYLLSRILESLVGLLILGVLGAVGWWVYQQQGQMNPALTPVQFELEPTAASPEPAPSSEPSWLEELAPSNLTVFGKMEDFNMETLSEKIDGRADLYLSAGFVSLEAQRFSLPGDANSWIELLVYDMGKPRNAFAVFSVQRREGSEDSTVTHYAYRAENSLFFVHGKFYVELVAAAVSDPLTSAMSEFAKSFVNGVAEKEEVYREVGLFPRDGLVPGSLMLLTSDAFGYERLNNLFVANYNLAPGEEITVFLSERESETEAAELVGAYHDFLMASGGVNAVPSSEIPEVELVNLYDTYEMIFSVGNLLAGVHAAESQSSAEQLALRLYQAIESGK